MFYGGNFERIRQSFASQFEESDGRILYRRWSKGAPIEVSAAERDAWIKQFNRDLKRVFAASMALMVLVLAGVFAWIVWGKEPPAWLAGGAIVPSLALMLAGMFWAWDRPAKALANRAAVGPARTREEMQARALEKLTWGKLGGVVLIAGFLLARVVLDGRLRGMGLYAFLLPLGLLALTAFQAARKLAAQRGMTLIEFLQAYALPGVGAAAVSVLAAVFVIRTVPGAGPWLDQARARLFTLPPPSTPTVLQGPPKPTPRQPIRVTARNANPDWLIRPATEQLAYYYPAAAQRAERAGDVVIDCLVGVDGGLKGCAVVSETPAGFGFGEAAIKIMTTYAQLSPRVRDGVPVEGAEVKIPVAFRIAADAPPRR